MYEGHRYIDADSHVLEPSEMWQDYLDPAFRERAPRAWVRYEGEPYAYVNECWVDDVGMPDFLIGKRAPVPGLRDVYGEYQALGFSPEVYKRVLDRSGIDYMLLYPTVGLFIGSSPTLDAPTAAAYRRAYNRWLHDFICEGDERMIGVASLDLRDPLEAAREARRCVAECGFRAVTVVPDPVTPHPWFDPFHDPLWAEIQDLDVPLAIHAGAGTPLNVGVDRYGTWAVGRGAAAFVCGNMLASMALIGGGVLERFPRLRVVHLEVGCGWVPYWLDRMFAGVQGANRAASRLLPMEGLSMHPVDYFRRQCFVACDPDDPHIDAVVSAVGDGCLVTATDFGHPEGRGYADAIRETLEIEAISDEIKQKIMWDNPARLYGLG